MSVRGPGWPTERGWYSIGLFVQTGAILAMIAEWPALSTNEFFKSLATAIVVTGWIGFAVGFRDNARDRDTMGKAIDLAAAAAPPSPPSPAAPVRPDPHP